MRRMTLLLLVLAFLALAAGCKKETCNWDAGIVSGKTFKITKVVGSGNGTSTDLTSQTLADACYRYSVTYTDARATYAPSSGCAFPNPSADDSGPYSVTTESGKMYITVTPDGSAFPRKTEVYSHDCDSYTLAGNPNSLGITYYTTFSKQ